MDILSHALWAGAAAESLRRTGRLSRRQVAGAVALGALPDLVALVPVIAWAIISSASFDAVVAYLTATPGTEPEMAAWARMAEHVHCSAHSVVVLAVATIACRRWLPAVLPAMLGWWMHLLLDIPTHSEEYYAVTLFYPFTRWSFDGIAWTTPWVLAVNYAALLAAYAALFTTRHSWQER